MFFRGISHTFSFIIAHAVSNFDKQIGVILALLLNTIDVCCNMVYYIIDADT